MDENKTMSDMLLDEQRVHYVVFDPDNRFSVENLVKEIPTLRKALTRVQAEIPHLLELDEGGLKEKIHHKLTLGLNRIRTSFWQEYEYCVQTNRVFRVNNLIGGICTDYHWHTRVLPDNEKMAWILCPPASYNVQVKEALQAGMETIREIVSAKVIDEDGFLIPRAADVVLKAVALLDMRVKGAIVQRIDQRSINLNMNANKQLTEKEALPTSMAELDVMIQQTKEKLKEVAHTEVRQLQAPMEIDIFGQEHEVLEIPMQSNGNGKTLA